MEMSESEISALEIGERIRPSEWTDRYLFVPGNNNILSKIDLSLTPYLRAPLNALISRKINRIFCVGPTQSGKTIFLQAAMGYCIDQDPTPMLMIYPTKY